MGVQYLTAESIKKMYNKAPLFKIDQSRVNSLRNIYIRLQKKKKNIPHIAIIQRSPISCKKSSPFQQLYISI